MSENETNGFSRKAYFEIALKRFLFYAFIVLAMLPGYFIAVDNRFGAITSLSAFLLYYLVNSTKGGLIRRHVWLTKFGVAILCVHVAGIFVPDDQKIWLVPLYVVAVPILAYLNTDNFSRFIDDYHPAFPWDE